MKLEVKNETGVQSSNGFRYVSEQIFNWTLAKSKAIKADRSTMQPKKQMVRTKKLLVIE